MSFLEFCKLCEDLSKESSKIKKINLLSSYLKNLEKEDLKIVCRFLSKGGFKLNLGYSNIIKVLLEISGKRDLENLYIKYGDLGKVSEDLMKEKVLNPFFKKNLSIKEVEEGLERIAKVKGSLEEKRKILKGLLVNMDPLEAKYLVKIITDELRIGVMEGTVEEALSKAFSIPFSLIHQAYLTRGDLGEVALLAKEGKIKEAKVIPFHPLSFMLADTLPTAEEIWEYYRKPLLAEYKYDGIRVQIHKLKDEVKIYSRRLEDITLAFPDIVASLKNIDKDFIIDGEILAFKDSPLPFHKLQHRLRKKEVKEDIVKEVPVKLFSYDILWINGMELIDFPLYKRREFLESLKGLNPSHSFIVSNPEEIKRIFEKSKEEGYEGLVIKDLDSKYLPGKRGKHWIKLKKEMDTLDVVIVAAEYGHGKRAGWLSDYTFAVKGNGELKVIGKAYSGLTDEEIQILTKKLLEITIKDEGFRKIVKPEIVLEVAFDSIQKSDRYGEGFALRFPRIKRIRWDKSVNEIDSIEKVKELYQKHKYTS